MILDKPLSVGHFGEKKQACVIYSVHVHPDGSRFATGGSDHRVRIWSMDPFRSPAAAVAAPTAAPAASSSTATTAAAAAAAAATDNPSPLVQGEDVQLLAGLSQHTGSVLCVRWSHGGRYLASASDDTFLLIWELLPAGSAAAATPFGSTETPNAENWSRVCVLRGHVMDVLDCAWSPDDSMLVSCSIDNKVIVWRLPPTDGQQGLPPSSAATAKILNPLRTLEQHTSFVKGVAWDPIGRFIASIGAENRLLVWRVGGSWDVEATVSEPFEDCDDTLVRRISWSPDGQFLVATNSKDGDTHNAVVLQRGRWHNQPTYLVGFSQATLAASFSPIMYKPASPPAANAAAAARRPAAHHVVAVAGQDNIVTVWLAAAARPVVVLREVFQQPPSDLSWGADGYTLVVSGYDGTVVVLRFTPEELGLVLPEADREAHIVKIYGKDASTVALALDGAPSLVDNPRQLALERARKEQEKKQAAAAAAATATAARANGGAALLPQAGRLLPRTPAARPLQIESRGKSGKRRIQPMLLSNGAGAAPQALSVAVPPPVGGTVSEGFGSAATPASSLGSPRQGGSKRPRTGGGSGGGGWSGQQVVGTGAWEGTVVRLRSPRGAAMPVVSPPELMPRKSSTGSLVRQISSRAGGDGGDAFRSSPRLRRAGGGSGFGGDDDGGQAAGLTVMECSALEEDFRGLPARRYTLVTVTRGGRELWRDYVAGMATACCGNDRMAAVGVEDGSVYVYDRNGVRSAPPLVISPPVAYLECSGQRPPPKPQPLSSSAAAPPAQSGEHLMAISGDGDVTVWNLSTMTLVVKTSLGPLFRSISSSGASLRASGTAAPGSPGGSSAGAAAAAAAAAGPSTAEANKRASVSRVGVTPEGMPLVMLACQGAPGGSLQAFTFQLGLQTWVRVADGRFALSDFYSSGPCTSAAARGGTLSALQTGVRAGSSPSPAALLQASKAGARPAGAAGAAGGVAEMAGGVARESLQSAVTRGHLEDSLSTAVLLGSSEEFVDVLRAYAGHLAKSAGFGHGRIRALCDKLLLGASAGGSGRSSAPGSEMMPPAARAALAGGKGELPGLRLCDGPFVMGLGKIYLLREVVLPALSENRSLQRLVSEYYDTLEFSHPPPPRPSLAQPSSPPVAERSSGAAIESEGASSSFGGSGTNGSSGPSARDGFPNDGSTVAARGSAEGGPAGSAGAASAGRRPAGESFAALNNGVGVANGGGDGLDPPSVAAVAAAAAAAAADVDLPKDKAGTCGADSVKQTREYGSIAATEITVLVAEGTAATGSSTQGKEAVDYGGLAPMPVDAVIGRAA